MLNQLNKLLIGVSIILFVGWVCLSFIMFHNENLPNIANCLAPESSNFLCIIVKKSNTISLIASLASILSLGFILPVLIWQVKNSKKQTEEFHKIDLENSQELRPIETKEGLINLVNWVKNEDIPVVLWVSKFSAIPGFWVNGPEWVSDHLKDYVCGSKIKRIFAGPDYESERFRNLAEMALGGSIPISPMFASKIHEFDDIKREYKELKDFLTGTCTDVILLSDEEIEKIRVNFVLRKASDRIPIYHRYELMFFDGAEILSGSRRLDEIDDSMEGFKNPVIYHSHNVTLAFMFQYFAYQTKPELVINWEI